MSTEEEVPFLPPEERQSSEEHEHDPEPLVLRPLRKRPVRRTRLCCVFSLLLASIAALLIVLSAVYFGAGLFAADTPNQRWISTSGSASDRFFCRWIGICGGTNWLHYHEPSAVGHPDDLVPPRDWTDAWIDPAAAERPQDAWDEAERARRDIPQYVLDYAPLVYLNHDERYWPTDPAEHLAHCVVRVGEEQRELEQSLSLATLGELNGIEGSQGGTEVYLTSLDDPESRPEWMLSRVNVPGWNATTQSSPCVEDPGADGQHSIADDIIQAGGWDEAQRRSATRSGCRSNAPAILITVPHDDDTLHAFWFFFNSFNEGNTVFGMRFGNHVGDWEHVAVRFRRGVPQQLFLSRHSWGASLTYDAVEKIGRRPSVYHGNGSHAHYPTAGPQPYVLPFVLLKDVTSRGPLWDPALNFHAYTYQPEEWHAQPGSGTFRASALSPRAPTSWLEFAGHWGDRMYGLNDSRQYRFFGELHYSSGPTGPRAKNLERELVCDKPHCDVKDSIG